MATRNIPGVLRTPALFSLLAVTGAAAAQEAADDIHDRQQHLPVLVDSPQTEPEQRSAGDQEDVDFSDLSLEELMQIEVTSVAGIKQPMLATPAAVFVITAEDIRRTGHRTLAEALRVVPGLSVCQATSNTWAVSARGFNGRFANKLLVLIDGRSVYTPLFSGVYWDVQDVILEDIDRIEVIRGPGATLWGANAVNGVINVVTKNARDTQGLMLSGGGGTEERGFGTLRLGTKLGDAAHLRFFGKYFVRDSFVDSDDNDRPGDWDMSRGGFRLDWDNSAAYAFTVQGDIYGSNHLGQGNAMPSLIPPFTKVAFSDRRVSGGNILLRLTHGASGEDGWSVQTYYDRTNRRTITLHEERDTFDIDFRYHFAAGKRHSVIWGSGYRHTHDDVDDTFVFSLDPLGRSDDTYSAFLQDTIELIEDRLSLMIGSKFEHNDYTGFEFQPGLRLAWTMDERQTLWASVARAVRTPSRFEDGADLAVAIVPFPVPTPLKVFGNPDVESEDLLAYEVGYRVRPTPNLLFDAAAFFNDYDDLITLETPLTNPLALLYQNNQTGESYGIEVSATWNVTGSWRLLGSYAWFKLNLHGGDQAAEDTDPRNQFNIRSYLDITDNLEFNAALYYAEGRAMATLPPYARVDMGMTWRPKPSVELSLWGQNLFDDRHPEFVSADGGADRPSEIERGVYAMIKVEF